MCVCVCDLTYKSLTNVNKSDKKKTTVDERKNIRIIDRIMYVTCKV